MDLVGACRAFVSVGERGSFTLGAAAARIPQPVASRRIAALEKHLGAPLFDRSARRATLTPFGREMLPSAQRLVRLADAMEYDAETARRTPLRLAVPDTCATLALARLEAEARGHGLHLEFQPAPPDQRAELLRSHQVRAAVVAVAPDNATWTVPLGLAGAARPRAAVHFLETLRPGRGESARRARRVWIQPEDDVPHVRDRLVRLGDTLGLRPAQVAVAGSLTSAVADTLDSADLLLCSADQAAELDLHWRPLGETALPRGYDLAGAVGAGADAERITALLGAAFARCLGAATGAGEAA
ncbi:LysR family transcriptional regulator [Streptomonospora sp. S1-112]|uniref:LysR family transcriptional regulator n=1 Tax=Streptomonospora mangrovi TaxID=2883123 RepID=A0A9X3P128_9ACTN|nr:LysR family transcriptional regulator [Streptomonospora mangrovi]MDA0567921.1 LysR family transcriptional regulator [Streptomonospora mangrovi]